MICLDKEGPPHAERPVGLNGYGRTEVDDMRKYLMHFLVIAVSGLLLMGCMADPAEPVAPTETETFMESTAG